MQQHGGRQYVFDADGYNVYGAWTCPGVEPQPDAVVVGSRAGIRPIGAT